jgi:hypothetical protein
VSTSTRQQIVEVIERALEPYGSLPADVVAALAEHPGLLRALAAEAQSSDEPQTEQGTAKHPADERCFYCATDDELAAGLVGRNRRTIRMDLPVEACPESDPADFQPQTSAAEETTL